MKKSLQTKRGDFLLYNRNRYVIWCYNQTQSDLFFPNDSRYKLKQILYLPQIVSKPYALVIKH